MRIEPALRCCLAAASSRSRTGLRRFALAKPQVDVLESFPRFTFGEVILFDVLQFQRSGLILSTLSKTADLFECCTSSKGIVSLGVHAQKETIFPPSRNPFS